MRVRILISGQVQGVFFRAYTRQKALELGLKGWVRNTEDGKVEAVFEGPKEKVEEIVKWCWKGTPGSKVEKVEEVEESRRLSFAKATEGKFEIRY